MTEKIISKYFNPWHNVNYGDDIPEFVNAIIEIPEGSKAKYELDILVICSVEVVSLCLKDEKIILNTKM